MPTIAPPAPPAVAVAPRDVPTSLVPCDRSGCPAPAVNRVDVWDQDFYFCGHHWRELHQVLFVPGARVTRPQMPT